MVEKNVSILPVAALFSPLNQKMNSALRSAANHPVGKSEAQLPAACAEMESLFINYLLKEMRATISKSGLISGGRGEEIFTSLLDAERSRQMSSAGGIGLAEIMLSQLGGEEYSKK
ncbi:hypothetical protein D1AOALGA4SA_214 [Olavius algarvensis Delta 1 endosymbiont]|nr:hypothetical protein D1AOALGA4SA_214 [Olavius algarvensis Delta 1 endosymbiont]